MLNTGTGMTVYTGSNFIVGRNKSTGRKPLTFCRQTLSHKPEYALLQIKLTASHYNTIAMVHDIDVVLLVINPMKITSLTCSTLLICHGEGDLKKVCWSSMKWRLGDYERAIIYKVNCFVCYKQSNWSGLGGILSCYDLSYHYIFMI